MPDDGCEFVLDPDAIYVSIDDPAAHDGALCGGGPTATGADRCPCLTLAGGLDQAQATQRSKVLVADGLCVETVSLVDGVRLLGGFRPDTWERHLTTTLTTLRGTASLGVHTVALLADGITSPTTVSGLVIEGPNNAAMGGNSCAIYVTGSGPALTISDNVVYAGSGGPGQSQTAAAPGTSGIDGEGRTTHGMDPAACDAFVATGSGQCNDSNGRQHHNGGSLSCGSLDVSGGDGGGNQCSPSSAGGEVSGTDGQAGHGGVPADGPPGVGGDAGNDGEMNHGLCTLPPQPMTGEDGENGEPGEPGPGGAGGSGGHGGAGGVCEGHCFRYKSAGTGGEGGAGGHGVGLSLGQPGSPGADGTLGACWAE